MLMQELIGHSVSRFAINRVRESGLATRPVFGNHPRGPAPCSSAFRLPVSSQLLRLLVMTGCCKWVLDSSYR